MQSPFPPEQTQLVLLRMLFLSLAQGAKPQKIVRATAIPGIIS
jgi:hypothetical protein